MQKGMTLETKLCQALFLLGFTFLHTCEYLNNLFSFFLLFQAFFSLKLVINLSIPWSLLFNRCIKAKKGCQGKSFFSLRFWAVFTHHNWFNQFNIRLVSSLEWISNKILLARDEKGGILFQFYVPWSANITGRLQLINYFNRLNWQSLAGLLLRLHKVSASGWIEGETSATNVKLLFQIQILNFRGSFCGSFKSCWILFKTSQVEFVVWIPAKIIIRIANELLCLPRGDVYFRNGNILPTTEREYLKVW